VILTKTLILFTKNFTWNGQVLNLGLCSNRLTTTYPSHGTDSTCLMPQYDDMKPKLKRNKSVIGECLGVVLMANALNVEGPRVKSQSRNWLSRLHFVFRSPPRQVLKCYNTLEHTMISRINQVRSHKFSAA
jgi:hypothetical protein